jgi:hypothetical protein
MPKVAVPQADEQEEDEKHGEENFRREPGLPKFAEILLPPSPPAPEGQAAGGDQRQPDQRDRRPDERNVHTAQKPGSPTHQQPTGNLGNRVALVRQTAEDERDQRQRRPSGEDSPQPPHPGGQAGVFIPNPFVREHLRPGSIGLLFFKSVLRDEQTV